MQARSASRVAQRERDIRQRRFWEHAICDAKDLERHVDYIHYKPVKHGLVAYPRANPVSTFHRFVQRGVYPVDKRCAGGGELGLDDIADTVGV